MNEQKNKPSLDEAVAPLLVEDVNKLLQRAVSLGARAGVISWFPKADGTGYIALTNYNDASGKDGSS